MAKITVRRALLVAGLVALGVAAYVAYWLIAPLFVDTVVEEELPFSVGAEVPPGMTRVQVEATMVAVAEVDEAVDEAMPAPMEAASASAVASGSFRDADRFHRGEGTATVYRTPEGALLLRLEEFRVTNGPDLRVLISPAPNPDDGSDVDIGGYVEVGRLKGNVGSQNYELPPGLGEDGLGSVIIYCWPFRVVFSVAALSPP